MGDFTNVAKTSALLDDDLRAQIRGVFDKLTDELEIVAIVDASEDKSRELLSLLYDVETLGAHVHVRACEPGECPQYEADFDREGRTPAMGLYKDGAYTGVAYYGVPGGKEMNSFILGCYNVAGPGQPIDRWTAKKLTKLQQKADLQIYVSLACHHCAATVISAQHLAACSPRLTATMIDANLYPDLIKKYQIERVPMVVINGERTLLGEKSMEELAAVLE